MPPSNVSAALAGSKLGVQRIDVNGRVLALLLLAEVAVLVVFDVAFVASPAPGGVGFGALNPAVLPAGSAGSILLIAFTGFIGFANLTVLAQQARDPRTVIRAAYLSLLIISVLFAASSWAITEAADRARWWQQQTSTPRACCSSWLPSALRSRWSTWATPST